MRLGMAAMEGTAGMVDTAGALAARTAPSQPAKATSNALQNKARVINTDPPESSYQRKATIC